MTLYTSDWRDLHRANVQQSAAALIPILVDRFHPSTAIDVGCGEGWFVAELDRAGVSAIGVDGSWVAGCVHVDLTAPPFPDLGPFDLALCLEVAEHVDESQADTLVGWLCDLAPIVVFSAAVPGQGGVGHCNEQPPGFWRDLFADHGRSGTGALRWAVWDDNRISPWYRQNLLVFADTSVLAGQFEAWNDGCPFVLHPGMWR